MRRRAAATGAWTWRACPTACVSPPSTARGRCYYWRAARTLVLSAEPAPDPDGEAAWARRARHESDTLSRWTRARPEAKTAPAWIRHLVLAADQFVVRRPLPDDPDGATVIAGYHWFGDWGRDTMIALPGLTLAAGRPEVARKILTTFARFVDGGMLPNNFPDAVGEPQYNTLDAALWYFEAVRQYFEATKDAEAILKLYPVLTQITSAHLHGTRYHIHVDAADGLLYAGEEGVQLTWMDAKVGDWVVTPRIGKPVEINALWYNALKTMAKLAPVTGKSAEPFQKMAEVVRKNFTKFWNSGAHCCYDVI